MITCITSMIVGTYLLYHSPSIIVKIIGAITSVAGVIGFVLIRTKEKKQLNAALEMVEHLDGIRVVDKKASRNGRIITVNCFIKDKPEEKNGEADDLP